MLIFITSVLRKFLFIHKIPEIFKTYEISLDTINNQHIICVRYFYVFKENWILLQKRFIDNDTSLFYPAFINMRTGEIIYEYSETKHIIQHLNLAVVVHKIEKPQ